jgi:hypothetical protein
MPRDSEWLPSMAQVAETIALTGRHPVARWAYDALSPYAGLVVVEGICAAVRGPVRRHLALLADALGEHEAAAGHRAELVEFSPTGPLNEMMGVVGKNLEAARAAGLAGGA